MRNDEDHGEGSLLALALLAIVAGALAGLVGAIFRFCLEQADRLRDVLIARAHGWKAVGFLLVIAACATRHTRQEAASLTSKRSCVASFRKRLFV
jgi:hypothetical protein